MENTSTRVSPTFGDPGISQKQTFFHRLRLRERGWSADTLCILSRGGMCCSLGIFGLTRTLTQLTRQTYVDVQENPTLLVPPPQESQLLEMYFEKISKPMIRGGFFVVISMIPGSKKDVTVPKSDWSYVIDAPVHMHSESYFCYLGLILGLSTMCTALLEFPSGFQSCLTSCFLLPVILILCICIPLMFFIFFFFSISMVQPSDNGLGNLSQLTIQSWWGWFFFHNSQPCQASG
jgi:hypothetical protein